MNTLAEELVVTGTTVGVVVVGVTKASEVVVGVADAPVTGEPNVPPAEVVCACVLVTTDVMTEVACVV